MLKKILSYSLLFFSLFIFGIFIFYISKVYVLKEKIQISSFSSNNQKIIRSFLASEIDLKPYRLNIGDVNFEISEFQYFKNRITR